MQVVPNILTGKLELVRPWMMSANGNIYYTSGNVGIGTTSPGSLLTLSGTTGLTMEGNSRVEKLYWIGANGIKAPGAKPATFVEDGLTGCWEFDDAIEANQESVSGTVKQDCSTNLWHRVARKWSKPWRLQVAI